MFTSNLDEKLKIRSTNINVIKFLCAIAVIVCHQSSITLNEDDFLSKLNHGQCNLGGIAVAVFFFLSGLYVAKSLHGSDGKLGNYLKKRCIRIFPQLWIVVLLSILMGAILTTYPLGKYFSDFGTYKYLLNGLLIPIHNLPGVFEGIQYQTVNGPLWTLSVEFAAYIGLAILSLIAGLLFKKTATDKRKIFDIISFCIIAVGLLTAFFVFGTNSLIFTAIRPFLIFFEGVLFFDFRDKIKLSPLLGAVALAITIALLFSPVFNIGLVFLFPYAFISLALGLPQIKIDWKLFKISYEMYLVGWPIQQIIRYCFGFGKNPYLSCFVAIPIDIIIGYLIFIAVECIVDRKSKRKNENSR